MNALPTTRAMRQSAATLRRALRELDTALEHVPMGLAVLDAAGRVTHSNARFADWLDTRATRLRGANLGKLLPSCDGQPFDALVTEVAETHRPRRQITTLERSSGERLTLELNLVPTAPHRGRGATRVVCTAQPYTGRNDAFLAALGHELRNPLATIRNGIALLERHRDDTWALEVMKESIDVMTVLLDDALDLERVRLGDVKLRSEPCDLIAVTRQVLDAVEPELHRRRLDVSLHVKREPLLVAGDPTRLTQIVTHLISSALEFSPEGGTAEVTLSGDDDTVVLDVRDPEASIEPTLLGRVFEPFSPATRTPSSPRPGLALALVRELTDLHGGTVNAFSDGPGRGASFRLTLPRSRPEAAAAG